MDGQFGLIYNDDSKMPQDLPYDCLVAASLFFFSLSKIGALSTGIPYLFKCIPKRFQIAGGQGYLQITFAHNPYSTLWLSFFWRYLQIS